MAPLWFATGTAVNSANRRIVSVLGVAVLVVPTTPAATHLCHDAWTLMVGADRRGARVAASRVPLNFFAIPFGLLGLADCWLTLAHFGQAPVAVADGILIVTACVWAAVLGLYVRYALSRHGAFAEDLADNVAGPFASLAVITPMLLAADGIYPRAPGVGRVLVDVLVVATVLLGAWFTGQWMYRPIRLESLHPGYFLPTVAGGFVASASAGLVGQIRLAEVLFGLALICWLVVGSIVLGRLLLGPPLPTRLVPTLAIEVAPAAVGSFAYFAIHGDHIDQYVSLLAGYGVLMVLAQIRLLPAFLRLKFTPGFWAFTFAWAAVAFSAMFWLNATKPDGYRVYDYLLLVAIHLLIGGIAARTVIAMRRGQLLPKAAIAAVPSSTADPRVGAHNLSRGWQRTPFDEIH